MTRDTPKAVERIGQLTPDELEAVSGGYQTGGSGHQKADGTLGAMAPFDGGGKGLTAACCDGKH